MSRNWNCYGTFNIFIEGERVTQVGDARTRAPEPADDGEFGWEERLREAGIRLQGREPERRAGWPPREPDTIPRVPRFDPPSQSPFNPARDLFPGHSGRPVRREASCPPLTSSFSQPGGCPLHPRDGAPFGPPGPSVFGPPSASIFDSPTPPRASQSGSSTLCQHRPSAFAQPPGPEFGQPTRPGAFGPIGGPAPRTSAITGRSLYDGLRRPAESLFSQPRPSTLVQPLHPTVESVSDDSEFDSTGRSVSDAEESAGTSV